MYRVKRNAKGTMLEFNINDYNEDGDLATGRDALNKMIDGQLIRFVMQPILSARTGDVMGYELLMRSDLRELPNPQAVLKLADAEGMLSTIERLTWLKGLDAAREMLEANGIREGTMFFLNSIANQTLCGEDERLVVKSFGSLLPRLVVEVTEQERNDRDDTDRKIRFVKNHGGKIAIDDYGTGYNSELALVKIDADIVKLDMSFVRGVDKDADKQALIRNLIGYARRRKIAVLAEGVETAEELRTLIGFGVDYLQGFYFGKPQYQPVAVDERLVREIRRASGEEPAAEEPSAG
jgi:EAL domain-containing protein (putative c-di-GMP-specific phosphodiesterase class I)